MFPNSSSAKSSFDPRTSWAYRQARSRARDYLQQPARLLELGQKAVEAALGQSQKQLESTFQSVQLMGRLLVAVGRGQYRAVSAQSLALIVVTLVYFVMPADFIPDWLMGLGFFDDAFLVGLTLKSLQAELEAFRLWEQELSQVA